MVELTVCDGGLEVGTVDVTSVPTVGQVIYWDEVGMKVVEVKEVNLESQTATVEVEYI